MTSAPESLASYIPFQGKFLGPEGCRQFVVDEGSGVPVVMVHGNPTWCFYYRNLVAALKDRYRCIVPDHIGCGRSDAPNDEAYGYSLEDRVNDLERCLDELVPDQAVHLVVHDWGGMIGMAWADRHPDQVLSFTILNTAGFRLPSDQPMPKAIAFARSGPGRWLIENLSGSARFASVSAFAKPVSREIRRAYRAPYEDRGRRVATRRFVEDIPLEASDPSYAIVHGVEQRLDRFTDRPAMIAWGMKDFVFTPKFLAAWKRHWPHAEVTTYDDCGHYVLEDAKDDLIPRIAAFLDDQV